MKDEVWKPVVGNPHYEVSSLGQVRSKNKILEAFPHSNGRYLTVSLARFNGTGFTQRMVHHLVLEAFVGEKPTPTSQGHHKNDDKHDNSVDNLEWLSTRAHNMLRRKIDPATSDEISQKWEAGQTMRKLAKEYGVGIATIHNIVHRRSK